MGMHIKRIFKGLVCALIISSLSTVPSTHTSAASTMTNTATGGFYSVKSNGTDPDFNELEEEAERLGYSEVDAIF